MWVDTVPSVLTDAVPRSADRSQSSGLVMASTQPSDIRRRNVAAVLRAVLAHGPISRTEIAQLVSLTQGTVTKLTTPLVSAGVLREQGRLSGGGDMGRPRVAVDLDLEDRAVIGMDIGLLRTTMAVVDLRAGLLKELTLTHDSADPDRIIAQAVTGARRLIRRTCANRTVLGMGVSIGGWVDETAGTVVAHPSLRWRDVPLRDRLGRGVDVPIRLDSKVRAHALGEAWFGEATRARSLLTLFIGNVVDAALVFDRAMHHGPKSAAGRVAHFPLDGVRGPLCECGSRNCFEAVVSDLGMLNVGRESGVVGDDDTFESILERARDGDAGADLLLRRRARWVGQAVAVMLDLINPDLVVLAGSPARAPEYLADLRDEARNRTHVGADAADRVVVSTLGSDALGVPSAELFLDAYYTDPLAFERTVVPYMEREH